MMNGMRRRRRGGAWLGAAAAILAAGATAPSGAAESGWLPAPGGAWGVRFDLPGFEIVQPAAAPAGGPDRLLYGLNPATGLEVSVTLEPVPKGAGPEDCRDHYARLGRKRSRVQRVAVEKRREGDAAIASYLMEGWQDGMMRQKHLNAYLARDGVCVDIHLSKDRYQWMDDDLFKRALAAIRIEASAAAPEPAPVDPPAAAALPPRPPAVRSFPVPGRTWSVVIETLGVPIDASSSIYGIESDGRQFQGWRLDGRWWSGILPAGGLSLRVSASKARFGGSAARCRSHLWTMLRLDLPVDLADERTGDRAGAAWIDYRKPWRQRARIETRVRHLFMAHDGACIMATLEKIDPRPGDEKLFTDFTEAARVQDDPKGATRP